jgi:hypothetical protein
VPEALQAAVGTDFIPYSEKKIAEWRKRCEDDANEALKKNKGKKPAKDGKKEEKKKDEPKEEKKKAKDAAPLKDQ